VNSVRSSQMLFLVAVPERSYNARQRAFGRASAKFRRNFRLADGIPAPLLLIPLRHRERGAGGCACMAACFSL